MNPEHDQHRRWLHGSVSNLKTNLDFHDHYAFESSPAETTLMSAPGGRWSYSHTSSYPK
jgi:hypothetical protein